MPHDLLETMLWMMNIVIDTRYSTCDSGEVEWAGLFIVAASQIGRACLLENTS